MDGLIIGSALDRTGGSSRRPRARHSAGGLLRVHSGAYMEPDTWSALDDEQRHRAKLAAVAARSRTDVIFSHESAALLLGIPRLGRLPERVHIALLTRTGGRQDATSVRRALPLRDEDVVVVDGLRCTSPARTALDLAATRAFPSAVVAVDHLLRLGLRLDEVRTLLELSPRMRGAARATTVLEFGSPLAETVIESASRANMRLAGLPTPILQFEFWDAAGFVARTDFFFPKERTVGEADGRVKYFDERYRGGRSAEQVVYDEKVREDRIRPLVDGLARWDWRVALSPALLVARLAPFGVRPIR